MWLRCCVDWQKLRHLERMMQLHAFAAGLNLIGHDLTTSVESKMVEKLVPPRHQSKRKNLCSFTIVVSCL